MYSATEKCRVWPVTQTLDFTTTHVQAFSSDSDRAVLTYVQFLLIVVWNNKIKTIHFETAKYHIQRTTMRGDKNQSTK